MRAKKGTKVERLVGAMERQTRAVYHQAGLELSPEAITEIVRSVVDDVWPSYLRYRMARFLGLPMDETMRLDDDDDD